MPSDRDRPRSEEVPRGYEYVTVLEAQRLIHELQAEVWDLRGAVVSLERRVRAMVEAGP